MGTIADYMAKTQKHCDELFADAESLADQSKWAELASAFQGFVTETEKHLKKEEDKLFPKVEQVTGSSGGPTQVMRMEHGQMRQSAFIAR